MKSRSLRVRFLDLDVESIFVSKQQLDQIDGILFDSDVQWVVEHTHVLGHAAMRVTHLQLMLMRRVQRTKVIIGGIRLVSSVNADTTPKNVLDQTNVSAEKRQPQAA